MWYVVQTRSGDEDKFKLMFEKRSERGAYTSCFIPMYEEVRRSGGKCRILIRRLFPGYVFLETEQPEKLHETLKTIPDFTRLLGYEKESEENAPLFLPITKQEETFLQTLLEDGVMHVSYVKMSKNNRSITQIVGPLASYKNHITHLEIRNREAIADVTMFGQNHHIRFGLWADGDPHLPWLDAKMNTGTQPALEGEVPMILGICPGDKVTDTTGVYGDYIFTVKEINIKKRSILTTLPLGNTVVQVEMYVENVRKTE